MYIHKYIYIHTSINIYIYTHIGTSLLPVTVGTIYNQYQNVQSVFQSVGFQLCRMVAMSNMAKNCEEDIASKLQGTTIAYCKPTFFGVMSLEGVP